jgi:D-alanyl-D-alanine carboxypeptidase
LAIALKNNNLFMPGEYWSYSNTGLLLLALIAEKIEATNFSEIVKNKLSTPHNLNTLKSLRPQETPSNLAITHKDGIDFETSFSTPLGAGNIVSNSKDMAVLLSLLLTGKILPIQTVHKMFSELYPMFDKGLYYGSGVMLYNFNEINNIPNQWIGHSGGTDNYKAILVYDFKTKAIMAVSLNTNVSSEAFAASMFGLIK